VTATSGTRNIIDKAADGEPITAEEIELLLKISPHTDQAGLVLGAADEINRAASNGVAEIHAQIGLNVAPCPMNCSFCAFAAKNEVFAERTELPVEQVIEMGLRAEREGANAIFIMATGDYPFSRFTEVSSELRDKLNPDTTMIANVGDFNAAQARRIKDAGYTGIYHAVRMGEGETTRIPPETRLRTVVAAQEAGLLVGTCVEPVGPEHGIDEIVEKTLIGRDMNPRFSGAMRRIPIPGSELERHGMLTEYEMAYLVAVVRLAMGRQVRGNCTHEPNILGASSGANLFWAEVGANPRDTEEETSAGRGLDVRTCVEMFKEADFKVLEGPSRIFSPDPA
jgi:biotin synthase